MLKSKIKKSFGLSNLALNNKTSVYVIMLILLGAGIYTYREMPKESFPEINIPEINIGTVYPGNSPVNIENLITRPIEKELKSIKGVDEIRSTSIQDYSNIKVKFDFDMDVKDALQEVKDAVDRSKTELPNDLSDFGEPDVFELDFSEMPILNVNISGNRDLAELKKIAEELEDEIEKLPEISGVDIRGALDKEVKVNIDPFKLERVKLSFTDIENAIARENVNMSGGDILTDEFRRNIMVEGEFKSMEELENIVVKSENQDIVYLKDVAEVSFDYEEPISYARSRMLPVVMLDVKKKSGENLIKAADKINALIKNKIKFIPKDVKLEVINDQSKYTRTQVDELENSIIFGVILVVLILLFFLGLRNAMFVGIAIPLSMLMGFVILNFSGTTLNMMVLFSLVLALGMLVDNGIVVVENIYRLMDEEGMDSHSAAKQGVGEVATPIIASTATTLAAFFPLLFWKDIMGEFMKYLPITLMIVLASSLFVALVINPVLTSSFMRVQSADKNKNSNSKRFWIFIIVFAVLAVLGQLGAMNGSGAAKVLRGLCLVIVLISLINRFVLIPFSKYFMNSIFPKFENMYSGIIRFALTGIKPYLYLLGTFLLLIFSLMYFSVINPPKFSFFPSTEPQYINLFIEEPIGTDITKTNELTQQIETQLTNLLSRYDHIIESIMAQVGEGTSDPAQGISMGSSPQKARITVFFKEFKDRQGISTSNILEEIRDMVEQIPGALITAEKQQDGPPVGKPVSIEVIGEDYERLAAIATDIRGFINERGIPGIEELKMDLETGKPELMVNIDRDRAGRFGMTTGQIAQTLRTALFGKEVSKYKEGEDDYPIQLRLQDKYRYDLQSLMNQKVTFMDQMTGTYLQVPISSVADVSYGSTYGSVKRKDLDRVITIYSNITKGFNANEINATLKSMMAGYEMPEGYYFKFTGEQEQQAESMTFLAVAFIIAFFLIFLIIVSQFNSVGTPFIIMASVLFSTIGVFLGFSIFNMEFIGLMCGIGIISLAGVVVNNAIVLIDYINQLKDRRREELGLTKDAPLPYQDMLESVIQGGKTRLRPVLLTAITTILGLIPLAIGLNIDFSSLIKDFDPKFFLGGDNVVFWGPMAWTVIFGLIFATFLTLVIVPVMYLLAEKVKRFFHRKRYALAVAGTSTITDVQLDNDDIAK